MFIAYFASWDRSCAVLTFFKKNLTPQTIPSGCHGVTLASGPEANIEHVSIMESSDQSNTIFIALIDAPTNYCHVEIPRGKNLGS